MCCDKPDTSGMNAAAQANAEIAKEALAFYKQQYAEGAPERAAANARAQAVSDAQLRSMDFNDQVSRDQWQEITQTYRPLERKIVAEAENYDTSARRESEAQRAGADINAQVAAQREQSNRANASMGVAPGSGRALALQAQGDVAAAAARAGAMTGARDKVELQGYARRMDAANLGRNLASNQATSAGVALNAGNSSAANGQASMAIRAAGANLMGQGFNTGMAGYNSSGQMYGQIAQMDAAGKAAMYGALGQLGGSAMGAYATMNAPAPKKE